MVTEYSVHGSLGSKAGSSLQKGMAEGSGYLMMARKQKGKGTEEESMDKIHSPVT